MVPPTLRIARPCNSISSLTHFYTEGLGLSVIGSFKNHEGFDGVMLGKADGVLGQPAYQWHLEFTYQHGVVVERAPTKENLLVFYEPDKDSWEALVKKVEEAGGKRVRSENPYWEVEGKGVTFEDPEGWRVVLWNETWP
jgi:catechol 2,3-dioxygenase-like lactoylglutathione lyase family enzyme